MQAQNWYNVKLQNGPTPMWFQEHHFTERSSLTKLYLWNKDHQVPYKSSGKIWTSLLENAFLSFLQSVFGTTNLPLATQYKVLPLPSIAISWLSGVTSQEGAFRFPGSKKYENKTVWREVVVIALLWKQKKEILRNVLSSLGTGHDSSVPGNLQLRLGPQ